MRAIAAAVDAPRESLSTGALAVLTLGALDFGLEQSIIVPALPDLAEHYGASLTGVAWLATGFLLASIVAVPLFGRLGDLLGKRRLLLASLAAFAAGSLVCALAGSLGPAIAGRVLQGSGAALTPLTLGLMRDTVTPDRLPRAVGAVVGAANVGGGIGFLLSGVLVDLISPAALFWFLFSFAVLLTVLVATLVRESPVRARVPLDPTGALLLGTGLVSLLLAISDGRSWGWTSHRIVGLLAAAAVLLASFAVVEGRVRAPLVDLRLVVTRPFANANLCAVTFGYAFFLGVFLVPQIAASPDASGYGLNLSTTEIGVLLVPTSLAGFLAGWAGGRAVDRLGPRALVAAGSLVGATGYTALAFTHDTVAALAGGSALIGASWGLILTGIYPVVLRAVASDKTAVAVAVTVVGRNTAVSVGITVAFAIVAGAGSRGGFPAEDGYTLAFLMGAAGAGFTLLLSMMLPRRSRG
jgi:MFS family permease